MKLLSALVAISACCVDARSRESIVISRENHRVIDSCLSDLSLAGRSADSATKVRIDKNTSIIRLHLNPMILRKNRSTEIDSTRFNLLLKKVENTFPYREQRQHIKFAAVNSKFTMQQTKKILKVLTFNDETRDAASILLPRTIDLENFNELEEVLWTPENKNFLHSFMDSLSQETRQMED